MPLSVASMYWRWLASKSTFPSSTPSRTKLPSGPLHGLPGSLDDHFPADRSALLELDHHPLLPLVRSQGNLGGLARSESGDDRREGVDPSLSLHLEPAARVVAFREEDR